MPTQIQIPGCDLQAQNDELFNLRQIRIFDFNLSDMMSFTVGFRTHTGSSSTSSFHLTYTSMKPFFYFDIFPMQQSGNISLFETQRIFIDRKKKRRKNLKTFFSQIFYICLIYQSVFILALSKYNALQWSIKVLFTCSKYMQSVKLAGYQENLPSKSMRYPKFEIHVLRDTKRK